jgi:4-hydroxybenzoate polyprenyltransferase
VPDASPLRTTQVHERAAALETPYLAFIARLPPLIRAMRPLQWTKNGLVFAPLLFTRMFFDLEPFFRTVAAAVIFCAISSAIYLVNDIRDVAQDRVHPKKRFRPIAAGELSVRKATIAAVVLAIAGIGSAFALRPAFAALVVGYIVLMIAYSHGLKKMVIIDVFAIAAGFVLRAAGGALALEVPISPWLYVCSMLLALFLGFGKRRNELTLLQESAVHHRANLDSYSIPVLDQIISVVSSATVIAYSFYTFDAPAVPDDHSLMLTIPFVCYAVFRYLLLIYKKDQGGSPEIMILTDKPLMICIAGWALTSLVILYR